MEIPVQGLDPAPPLSENKEGAKAAAETAALLEEAAELGQGAAVVTAAEQV